MIQWLRDTFYEWYLDGLLRRESDKMVEDEITSRIAQLVREELRREKARAYREGFGDGQLAAGRKHDLLV